MARARRGGEMEPAKPEPLPWERQKGESLRAYSYFALYRDLGPQRSLGKVAASTKLALGTIEQHSARWRWVERADAYWEWWERRQREENETERARVNRAHLGLGAQLLVVAQTRLAGRPAAVVRGGARDGQAIEEIAALSPADLDAQDVARFAKVGVEIQRLAAGLATSHVGISKVSQTELAQTIRDVVELALSEIAPERQPRFMARIEAYFEGGRQVA